MAVVTPTIIGLRASTVTPGSTPPDESLTVPSTDPRCSWAATGAARSKHTKRHATALRIGSPRGPYSTLFSRLSGHQICYGTRWDETNYGYWVGGATIHRDPEYGIRIPGSSTTSARRAHKRRLLHPRLVDPLARRRPSSP